ncbi:MAG: DUF2157 domain-containing protein [Pseudomonadota bacterium]
MSELKHWKWLKGQLPEWIDRGIITSEQSERIINEQPIEQGHSLLTRILISISALFIGLGVISFFAYNWQDMTKWMKLATIFLSFIIAHGVGLWLGQKPEKNAHAEFCHLLGSFLFGAAIILIAQIYHIDEHAPNGILLWSIGPLLMMFILKSTPQMLLFAVLVIIWQIMEIRFDALMLWPVLYVSAPVILFSFYNKNWFPAAIATVSFIVVCAIQCRFSLVDPLVVLLSLGALSVGAGLLIRRSSYESCAVPPEAIGLVLYFVMLITFTFPEIMKHTLLSGKPHIGYVGIVYPVVMTFSVLAIWVTLLFPLNTFSERIKSLPQKSNLLVFAGFILTMIILFAGISAKSYESKFLLKNVAVIGFNIIALFHGIVLIFSGTGSGRTGISFAGCLIVVIVIIARFMSFTDNLLIRSFCFLLAGVFILAVSIKTSKVKKNAGGND